MWIILVAACALLNSALAFEYGCLPGWNRLSGNTKVCIKLFNDEESYFDALSICQEHHGYLVQIQDWDKNSMTNAYLLGQHSKKAWIATWKPNNETYELFLKNLTHLVSFEKSEVLDELRNREKCIRTWYERESRRKDTYFQMSKWSLEPCNDRYPFICERPKIRCPDGWEQLEFSTGRLKSKWCFRVESDQKLSWHDAQSECQQEQGDLFLPIKGRKANFVIGLQKKNTHYWIGIADEDEDGEFHFLNGENMTDTIPWRKREPNNAHGNEHCGEMKDGLLYDKRCGRKRNFVCELTINYY